MSPSLSLARRPKPDPAKIYVSICGFAFAGNAPEVIQIHAGARRRGSDRVVIATFPELWLPDGATDLELAVARDAARHRSGAAPYPSEAPPRTGYGDPHAPPEAAAD